MMTAADVVDISSALSAAALSFWLDGGWGVDALLGEQTRQHDDLDVVVLLDESDSVIACLAGAGFALSLDARPTRFVLADDEDRRIDCHPVVFDEGGGARQIGAGAGGGDAAYPADGFGGEGSVDGHAVRCLTPRLLVRHHMGYEPLPKDWHNVRLLCERFGIAVPESYARFVT